MLSPLSLIVAHARSKHLRVLVIAEYTNSYAKNAVTNVTLSGGCMWNEKKFQNFSLLFFTCNHVLNRNKKVSAAKKCFKTFAHF